jgi:uncharacterized protein (DUF1919 family)
VSPSEKFISMAIIVPNNRLKSIINTKINRKTANNGCTTISKNTPNSHTTKEPFGGGFKRTYLIEGAGL